MNPLYTIIFEDSTAYLGGDYNNTKWNDIPNKKIRTIFYFLPNGDSIGLTKYDKYYHMIEVVEDLNGINRGIKKIEYTYIMGLKDDNVKVYRINLCDKGQDKIGNIRVLDYKIDDDFIKSLNKDGWK